jgi:hypothetical protein
VAKQDHGRLPANWDATRRNIAVFPSSEDELAAIGAGWQNPIYATQLQGLQRIIQSLSADPRELHLYVRVHPNLQGVANNQTRGLAQLQSPLATVIPPEDPVSTYALMHACEKVLTFGSTTGIEAVYWGRPSLLAGISFYRQLGGTYNPSTHEDLVELLKARLTPRDPLPALMYGFYQATFGLPYHYFQPKKLFHGRFNGRRVRATLPVWLAAELARIFPSIWPLGHRAA